MTHGATKKIMLEMRQERNLPKIKIMGGNFITIKDIIELIPDILQYFVSGYIFISIFKSICSIRVDTLIQIIYSCVISFSLISGIRNINETWIHAAFLNGLWGLSSLVSYSQFQLQSFFKLI